MAVEAYGHARSGELDLKRLAGGARKGGYAFHNAVAGSNSIRKTEQTYKPPSNNTLVTSNLEGNCANLHDFARFLELSREQSTVITLSRHAREHGIELNRLASVERVEFHARD